MKDIIKQARKENKVFKYLFEYFFNKTNKTKELLEQSNSYVKFIGKLFEDKRITLEESDILEENIADAMEFVLYVISLCPDIHIIFNNSIKGGN